MIPTSRQFTVALMWRKREQFGQSITTTEKLTINHDVAETEAQALGRCIMTAWPVGYELALYSIKETPAFITPPQQ